MLPIGGGANDEPVAESPPYDVLAGRASDKDPDAASRTPGLGDHQTEGNDNERND